MKRLAFSLVLLLGLFAVAPVAHAATGQASNAVTVSSDQSLTDDFYAAGETVTISGTVRGDVVAAGSDVVIEGTVTGSVWAAGSTVRVSGTVGGSVRAAAQKVLVSGKVGRDVVAFGEHLEIGEEGSVGGDFVAFGSRSTVAGTVAGIARLNSDRVLISGSAGSVDADTAGEFRLASTARVEEGIRYTANEELIKERGARVGGAIDFTQESRESGGSVLDDLNGQIFWFLASILLLLGILLYARRGAVRASKLLVERPGISLLAGLGFVILVPILAFILLITAVGLPLSAFAMFAYALVLYTAKLFVALAVGGIVIRKLPDKFWPTFGAGVIGLSLYYVLAVLPGIGLAVSILTTLFGTGAQLLLFREVYGANRKKYGV